MAASTCPHERTEIRFRHNGALEKLTCRAAVAVRSQATD